MYATAASRTNLAGYIRFSFLLIFFCGTLSNRARAQEPFLLLKRTNSLYQITIFEGEEIRFRLHGDKHYRQDHILGLKGNEIRFHYYSVNLDDIQSIDVRSRNPRSFFRSGPGKLIFAGVALIGIDQLNQVVVRDEPAGVSTGIAIVSGSLIGAGILLKVIDRKYFRPGKKSIIRIVDPRENQLMAIGF